MIKTNPAKFFVYCALIFGIIFTVLIPPFQSPDEDSHFKRAYVLSKGKLYPEAQNGVVGYYLPDDMVGYISEKLTFIGNRDKKYSYSEAILDDRLPKDYSKESFYNFSTAEVTPFVYIAPALGILFAKASAAVIGVDGISATVMLQFARLFSLLAYILIIYYAIKITPVLKKTFCVIGLIPMSLALASAISYDSVLTSLSMLLIALLFKLIFDDNVKKVTYKHVICVGIIGFVLLSVKMVYFTLLLPLIFIPKEKLGENKKSIIKTILLFAGIILGCYILNKIPFKLLQKGEGPVSHASEQVATIINNPFNYLKIWLSTMWHGRYYYYSGMVGIFGLIDTYIPTIYMVIYTLGAIAVVISELSMEDIKFNWKHKIAAIISCVGTIFAIFLGMYVLWTSMELGVGVTTITGVQGRYFLPIIPLAVIIFSNSILKKNDIIKNYLNKILNNFYIVPCTMLIISTLTIFLRFWC